MLLSTARDVATGRRVDAARRRVQAADVALRVPGTRRARRSVCSSRSARETGLPVVTEVMDTRQVDLVAEHADMLQVGARNMQNFALLAELGRVRRPVLLKRGLSATIKELLMAAEYIMANGNHDVVLCERGIRTFETATRNTLDIAAIPVLKRESHLPVIVDPSHAGGDARPRRATRLRRDRRGGRRSHRRGASGSRSARSPTAISRSRRRRSRR